MGYQDELQAFLQQAQEISAQVQAASAHMAAQEVTGACEGGAVQITMTSGGEVRSVNIQPRAVNLDNLRHLEQLVAEAVQNALDTARGAVSQAMQPFAESFDRLAAADRTDT